MQSKCRTAQSVRAVTHSLAVAFAMHIDDVITSLATNWFKLRLRSGIRFFRF
jgi:hypothetical protein